ncbi:MAG TPA: 30S ribosome-binding factor RbfA [Limnochordia bacterium]|mgnify:CR=1 FL=1|nr:30S ribosome-binding factor RbfA [Limnochordia bacterium]
MSERLARLAQEIKREVSSILTTEVKDPRLGMISITDVEVSRDLSLAKVYFSQLGDEEERARTMEGLERAKGFIRSELAKRIRVRHIPEIAFVFDPSLEHGAKMDALLRSLQIAKEDETTDEQS